MKTSGSSPEIARDSVQAQAQRWFARMRSDRHRPVDGFLFRRWLAEDPAHEREYRDLEALWDELSAYSQADEIRKMRRNALAQIGGRATSAWARRHHAHRWVAAAAVAAITIGGLFAYNPVIYQASYETGVGGRHSFRLLDGSRITLNTDTEVRIEYDLRSRRVWLENGQAHFKVARSSLWPFEVDAGDSVIRAVGTAFDVYRRQDEVQVTLVEGEVVVAKESGPGENRESSSLCAPPCASVVNSSSSSSPNPGSRVPSPEDTSRVLHPGQQILVTSQGLSEAHPTSIPKATAWLHGRLVFDNEPLRDAIAEVNRYSPVQLVIEDPALAAVRVSGVFRAGRAEGFVDALQASFPVQVRADGSLVIAPGTDGPLPEHITAGG